ncbi:T9SS type A sorting domain-containing protein [Taibaiella lutea]|uniref:T9SS type A sorting domain-containing protein n=1 Tax=Taibaiella lutea TaxID=2608001 RepID=A0A5M6CEP7_9BACT|nr:T9SS type A sorting domain-containing protein [Taibaiella lutea]KAA5533591.1 T9SS type A sorting domain-containing protein [Taibaiella lutea]
MKQLLASFLLMLPCLCVAQDNMEFIKNSDLSTFHIDSAKYSESTSAVRLKNNNIMLGGFYRKDKERLSCILLFNPEGKRLKNAYKSDFLSFYLYEENENFVSDLANAKDGGVYLLGTTAQSNYYTGYLVKLSNDAEIDEHFQIPNSTDTGFINIHNYSIAEPHTENKLQELIDTTYSEPKKLLIQPDGKILIVAVTRKQNTEANYADGESYVMRLFPNGLVDSSFGLNGIAHINLSDKCDDVVTALLDDEGRIVLFGKYNHDYTTGVVEPVLQTFITRLTTRGRIDKSFGNSGSYIFEYPDSKIRPVKALLSGNSSMLFFSNIETHAENGRFYYRLNILKLEKDGVPDLAFHDQGVQIIGKMGIAFANDIQPTPDKKFLICGTNQNLLKDHLDGDEEILFRKNESSTPSIEYTEEALNNPAAVGFLMRLDSDCNIDTTFPKNGGYFTSRNDLTEEIFFSDLLISDANHFTVFGAGQSEEMHGKTGFLVQRVVTELNLGEIACKKDMGLSFYPNPIKDIVNVEFDLCQPGQVSASLYSMSGQSVQDFFLNKSFSKGHQKEVLQINKTLAPGVYILVLRSKDHSKSVKVIVAQ